MTMVEDRMVSLEQRMAKVEGILEQISLRLTEVEHRLTALEQSKADKWEIRIWFIILFAFMAALKFI